MAKRGNNSRSGAPLAGGTGVVPGTQSRERWVVSAQASAGCRDAAASVNGRAHVPSAAPQASRISRGSSCERQSRAADRRVRFRHRRADRTQGTYRAAPGEDFIYLGDTARLPYGTKSNEVIIRYSRENTEFLLAKGIKLLVVACNTSSAVALGEITRDTMVPVIGVIEPGARAAVKASRSGKIGVIGTEATIASGAYTRAIQRLKPRAEIYTRACPLLVPLVEEGWTDNEIAERTVAHYLESLKASGIDTLLLGCTHYPLLRGMFERVLGPRVRIVDSATATAGAVAKS